MIHPIKRATRRLIFCTLVAVAVLLSVMRLVFLQIDSYKTELEAVIASMIDAPCKIGQLRINIYGVTPKLLLNEIDILTKDGQQSAIVLRQIQLRLDLLSLLSSWDILAASRVTLIGANISVTRKANGGIAIVGLKASDDQPEWLLQSGQYEMLDSTVKWQDQKRQAASHQFNNVDIFINNQLSKGRHQINVAMDLPDSIGQSLQLSMLFSGNIFQSNNVSGHLYAQGTAINFAELASGDLPMQIALHSGLSDFKLWSEWSQAQMLSLLGEISLEQSKISFQNNTPLLLQHGHVSFYWQQQDSAWHLQVKKIILDDGSRQWHENDFSVWLADNEKQAIAQFSAAFQHLDIGELSAWLMHSQQLPEQYQKHIQTLNPSGILHDAYFFADLEHNKIALNGTFEQLGFAAVDDFPGMAHLSGLVYGSEQEGYVQLLANDTQFIIPSLFHEPLSFLKVQGKVRWSQEADQWVLSSSLLALDSLAFHSRHRGQVTIPKDAHEKLFVDAQTHIAEVKELRSLLAYLPTAVMSQEDVLWADNYLLAGQLLSGQILFYGYPQDYPFVSSQGICEVSLQLRNFGVNYNPQWPYITEMEAQVLLSGDRLQVNVSQGKVNGATLQNAVGSIASLYDSDYLQLQGQVVGTIGQSIGFLQQTPLAPKIYPILQAISIQGKNTIEVKMQLPFSEHLRNQVEGVAHLSETQIRVLAVDLPVTGIQGRLKFTQNAVYSDTIQATALGYPLQIKIDDYADYYSVTALGKTDVDKLRVMLPSPLWDTASGQFDYHMLLTVPYQQAAHEQLHISSDLTGLALALPEPFAKTEQQVAELALHMDFNDYRYLPLTFNYADVLKAALEIDREQENLYSANIIFGDAQPDFLHYAGKRLEIQRQQLLLTPWLSNKATDNNGQNFIDDLKVHVEHVWWQGQDFGQIEFNVKKKQNQWQGDFNTQFAAGVIALPVSFATDEKISLDLHFINLDKFSASGTEKKTISAVDFPLFKINSRHVFWNAVDLGVLSLDTERATAGILFKQFMINKPQRRLSLFGSGWKTEAEQTQTDLVGTLDIGDFGVFLSEMQITDAMRKTPAKIDFSAHWDGGPFDFSLADMSAQIDVVLGAGRLLGVEPGVGRLLGMLDLAQMGRRLQLDFSDVYAEGLSYDQIHGSFLIKDGYASTENLLVDALPTIIKITGKTGLVSQDFDQIITVIPKSSAVIPIAGTIVQGLTSLVAEKITGQHQDGLFFGMQYAVKGRWGEAEIIPLHEKDGLIRKAWLGITDFSWLGIKKEQIER